VGSSSRRQASRAPTESSEGTDQGKTAAPRVLTAKLNPHRYQVSYHAETDSGRRDLYRCLARSLGLTPSYRRALLWREIKAPSRHLADPVAFCDLLFQLATACESHSLVPLRRHHDR